MTVALLSTLGVVAFSRNVATNLAPQCRALKIEKSPESQALVFDSPAVPRPQGGWGYEWLVYDYWDLY